MERGGHARTENQAMTIRFRVLVGLKPDPDIGKFFWDDTEDIFVDASSEDGAKIIAVGKYDKPEGSDNRQVAAAWAMPATLH